MAYLRTLVPDCIECVPPLPRSLKKAMQYTHAVELLSRTGARLNRAQLIAPIVTVFGGPTLPLAASAERLCA
jgi:hypothetical protein